MKSPILAKVIEFCRHYKEDPMTEIQKPLKGTTMQDIVQEWYAEYIDDVDMQSLNDLTLAANYMHVAPLLSLTCSKLASKLVGKTTQEMRTIFNIVNDFTPEEEAQMAEDRKYFES